jgi:hypothetical protein
MTQSLAGNWIHTWGGTDVLLRELEGRHPEESRGACRAPEGVDLCFSRSRGH